MGFYVQLRHSHRLVIRNSVFCMTPVMCIDTAGKWVSDAVPNELIDFRKYLCKTTVCVHKISKKNKILKIQSA